MTAIDTDPTVIVPPAPLPPSYPPDARDVFDEFVLLTRLRQWLPSQKKSFSKVKMTEELRVTLFDAGVGQAMLAFAEAFSAHQSADILASQEALRLDLEKLQAHGCEKCKQPLHPKQDRCWFCAYQQQTELRVQDTRAIKTLREFAKVKINYASLAIEILQRATREKKKSKFVRLAKTVLEFSVEDPIPPPVSNPWDRAAMYGLGPGAGILAAIWATTQRSVRG